MKLDNRFEEALVTTAKASHDNPRLLPDFVELLEISIKKYNGVA